MPLTNAELAILSLVAEKPRHGYEIEQVIEERGMREWTEVGFSSIYYLLKKLEKEGLVEAQLEKAERGPARKVYRATQDGFETLREGVVDALSVPHPCHSPLQLGLANLPLLDSAEVIAALQAYKEALTARAAHVQTRWEEQRPLPFFVDAMFEHSLTIVQAEIEWVETFTATVQRESI